MNKKTSGMYRIASVGFCAAALVSFIVAFLISIFVMKILFIGLGVLFILCGIGFALLSRYFANPSP
jgi:hypothetical protein